VIAYPDKVSVPVLAISKVLGSPIIDPRGTDLGRLDDLILRLSDEDHPPIIGAKARIGGRALFVPLDRMAAMEPGAVRLTGAELDLRPFERREGEILLANDLLGRRVISLASGRLVRVGDIELAETPESWIVVGVDIRLRSRLDRIIPGRKKRRDGEPKAILDWATIQPFLAHVPTARVRIPYQRLARLHPHQIADLVEAASYEEGSEIINAVGEDRELEADVFEELSPGYGGEYLRDRSDEQVASVLASMNADDAADMLVELDQRRRANVLALLPEAKQRTITDLLGYHPETAGGLMTPEFATVAATGTVADAREALRTATGPPRTTETVYAIDEAGALTGVASAGELLRADRDAPVAAILRTDIVTVDTTTELAEIACLLADYNLAGLPVVNGDGQMIGLVTIDDVLPLVIPEDWRRRAEASRED
jgi:CBS domain-containing protein